MWVQPVNGVPQGDGERVVLLVTPKKQQIITAAAQYFINEKSFIKAEMALSNYDVNTFSSKDKQDDNGVAGKLEYVMQKDILKNVKEGLTLQTALGYEFVQDHFRPVERLRIVEFNRNWGLPFC